MKWVDLRAQFLAADALIEQSFDPYVFVRDAYLQTRAKLIADNLKPYQSYIQRQAQALTASNEDLIETQNVNLGDVPDLPENPPD